MTVQKFKKVICYSVFPEVLTKWEGLIYIGPKFLGLSLFFFLYSGETLATFQELGKVITGYAHVTDFHKSFCDKWPC